jgi:hypothetical protein
MDEIVKELASWLLVNYPILLFITGGIIVILYILKELKEVFFSTDSDGQRFGTYLKHVLFFWLPRSKRVIEPKHIQYSNEEREKILSKLLVHNFFQSVILMKRQISNMDFGYEKKNDIFRDIIKIYVETIEKYATYILKNYKLDELETSKLNEILLQEIDKATIEIYSKMRERLGDVLYKKLIEDPVRGFKVRNSIFREIFINGVTLISAQAMSVYNYDNYERASEILTSMYVSLNVIVKNFEKVFKDYNGELDKYIKEKKD